jgi:inorganic pyrophosphatase/exopolyphosphatase
LDLVEKLEKYSIDLLMTAILSNTLNFKAQITKERDIIAYEELRKLSTLPSNWKEIYFHGV